MTRLPHEWYTECGEGDSAHIPFRSSWQFAGQLVLSDERSGENIQIEHKHGRIGLGN